VTRREGEIAWEAGSPEEWFAHQEELHPVWRWMRRVLTAERWDALRRESVAVLRAGGEDPGAFQARGPYVASRAVR